PECVRSCRGCLSKGSRRHGERRTRSVRRPRAPRATTRGVETGSGLSRTGVAVATAICFNPRSIIGLPRRSKAVYYSGSLHPLLHAASASFLLEPGLNLCVVFVPPMSSQPTRESE
ncbi:hypothetical protein E2986_10970, partial [Frieseomelitta varia]